MTSLTIFSVFGGVMLLLYGMRLVGRGLQKAAGARLRSFLLTAMSNRFKGMVVGAAITALLQSSSATTVMLVGFVGAGFIALPQTIGVILGANIGTTLTVQIIAFRVYDYAIAVVGLGILLIFLSKKGPMKDIGLAILGFGFVFLALNVLTSTFTPLTPDSILAQALLTLNDDPVAGVIVAALITAILHSSAATLGLAITATHSGLLTPEAALPIVLGANLGTSISAIISSIGAPVDAKRVAMAHVFFKAAGVIIVLPFISFFTGLAGEASGSLARQVANAHTFFNLGLAVLFIPFTGLLTTVLQRLMPEREEPEREGAWYLDQRVISTPSLALGQATREALRVADMAQVMLRNSIKVFQHNDKQLMRQIAKSDNELDVLDREIKLYLTKLIRETLSDSQASRELEIISFTNNMENIGDVIDKNLMELARKKINRGYFFSIAGMEEIEELHLLVLDNFELGVAAFVSSDKEIATQLLSNKIKIADKERRLREAHIERLHKGLRESIETSSIHLDVLTNLKRINSYITSIAYSITPPEASDGELGGDK
jgi:phosphate:Na+ symporter